MDATYEAYRQRLWQTITERGLQDCFSESSLKVLSTPGIDPNEIVDGGSPSGRFGRTPVAVFQRAELVIRYEELRAKALASAGACELGPEDQELLHLRAQSKVVSRWQLQEGIELFEQMIDQASRKA